MSDLPLHEGVVGVMRHYGDPSFYPADLYRLNLGHTNQLFYLLAVGLSFVMGTTWAVKVVVAAMQVALLVAGGRLADHLGRSRWSALLFAPLALGFTYYWGLVTNLTGFACFFGCLPLFDRTSVRPNGRSMLQVHAALLLLYFAHESVLLIALGFLAVLAVARPLDGRLTPLRILPIVTSAAFAIVHFVWSRKFLTGGQLTPPPLFATVWEKALILPQDLFGSHDLVARLLLFGLGLTGIGSLLAGRILAREPLPGAPAEKPKGIRLLGRLQELLLHYRFEAVACAFVAAWALSPETYQGATLLHERFVGPAWALFAVTAGPRGPAPRIARLATVCLPVGMWLLSWPQFLDSDQTYRRLDELIAKVPLDSSVALAALDHPLYKTRVYSAGTGPARTVALRGGRMQIGLFISPISPVQLQREVRWDELDVRTLISGSRALMPAYDLTRFGWVIAEARNSAVRDAIIEGFRPDAELVATSGEWLLLRSTHPQKPLTSPDAPPRVVTDTILDRVTYIVKLEEDRERQRERGATPPERTGPLPWQVPGFSPFPPMTR
jgi:hypothetical protein